MPEPFRIGPFTGGVNLADPAGSLEEVELTLAQNWRIDPRGNPYKRPGFGGYGAEQFRINGNNPVNFLHRYYKSDGSKKLVGAAGGLLKFGNDASGEWTNISINGTGASMHATNLVDYIVYKDVLYLADGTQPQRYNGVDNFFTGLPTPNSAGWGLAQSTNALGKLTLLGAYRYLMTFVMGDRGEGTGSAERTITLTGTNNRITLSSLDTVAGCTSKKLYRTLANSTVFYLLATLNPGDTSYVDDIADSALSFQYQAVHAPRADSRFVVLGHDERTYWFGRSGINASIVEPSDVGFPERILDSQFFAVSNNDGDVLTGGARIPAGIVFFKRNSMWLMRAFGFGLINISSTVGTVAPFSVVEVPGGLIFVSQKGKVYHFDGTNLNDIGRKIQTEFVGMTETGYQRMVATYHSDRYILSYDYRGLKSYNNRRLEFDLVGGKWEGPHKSSYQGRDLLTASYFTVWDSQLDKGELYWGQGNGNAGSFVFGQTEFTVQDSLTAVDGFGAPVDSEPVTKTNFQSKLTGGKLAITGLQEKKVYKLFVDGKWDGVLTATVSGESPEYATDVEMGSEVPSNALIWGQGNWGQQNWGGPTHQVAEGPIGPRARQRRPIFDIDDKATCSFALIERIDSLIDALPLK